MPKRELGAMSFEIEGNLKVDANEVRRLATEKVADKLANEIYAEVSGQVRPMVASHLQDKINALPRKILADVGFWKRMEIDATKILASYLAESPSFDAWLRALAEKITAQSITVLSEPLAIALSERLLRAVKS